MRPARRQEFRAHGLDNRAAYDNLTVSYVPEASMAVLFALGLGGVLMARRQRRA